MAKRLLLLLSLVFAGIFLSKPIFAQRILGAVSLGMNLTQVDGDEFYGFNKVGLNVGPQVIIPFGKKKNWSVSMELLYSQKGSYHRGGEDSTRYRLTLDYAEIPILIHYTDKKLISGGVGFSYSRLINFRETKNHFYEHYFTYQHEEPSINDFSVIADIQIRLWSKLWAGLRYQYSVKSNRTVSVDEFWKINSEPFTRNQYNNVISLRLTWVFNQAKIEKKPARSDANEE